MKALAAAKRVVAQVGLPGAAQVGPAATQAIQGAESGSPPTGAASGSQDMQELKHMIAGLHEEMIELKDMLAGLQVEVQELRDNITNPHTKSAGSAGWEPWSQHVQMQDPQNAISSTSAVSAGPAGWTSGTWKKE